MEKIHTFVVLAYKQSKYLEECIQSVLHQKYKSKVVIATSTPNNYITMLSKKYHLNIVENNEKRGIGADFDFALSIGNTELVTIAHQDDIYDYEYSYRIIQKYKKNRDSIIIVPDYYEIRNQRKIYSSVNLVIKRVLMSILRFGGKTKFAKRFCLRFGDPICCPAVTFVKEKIEFPLFNYNMKCDIDWHAWEILSKKNGAFSFINKKLMGHRVHEQSTTTEIINNNIRTKEDIEILKRFWPNTIAKLIARIYKNSEKSNVVKEKNNEK